MAGFIKFDSIDGEANDKDHKGWSDIAQFGQAMHKPGGGATGATRRSGDVIMEDLSVTKELDKASPKIAEAVCTGQVVPKVEIDLTASTTGEGRVSYYKYELKNVAVTSYNISGSGQSDDVPMEDMALNYEEIKVSYNECDNQGKSKGTVEMTWKVEEGES